MKLKLCGAVLLTATTLLAQTSNADKSADQLRDLASNAKHFGDLLGEAKYLCQAAALDSNKYEKKCAQAKEDVDKALSQFQTDLVKGRSELQKNNYLGASHDLEKITFGPNRAEAQDLIQLARVGGNGGGPVDLASYDAFNSAREAYLRGDFDTAQSEASRVQYRPIQNVTNQLLTNIRVYRETMKQAEELVRSGDLKGAEQKYQFAIVIKQNGPGNPQDRLRDVQAAEVRAANARPVPPPQPGPAQPQSQGEVTAVPQKSNDQGKTNSSKPAPNEQGRSGGNDAKPKLRPLQGEARHGAGVAGTKATPEKIQEVPQPMQASLVEGVKDFYASRFSHADDAIKMYLQTGGTNYAGAAHFYLGASLLTQALLTSPNDRPRAESLRQQAWTEFTSAKQLHYEPVESAVSPKVLGEWAKTGDRP
jgi:hypothetical protein